MKLYRISLLLYTRIVRIMDKKMKNNTVNNYYRNYELCNNCVNPVIYFTNVNYLLLALVSLLFVFFQLVMTMNHIKYNIF